MSRRVHNRWGAAVFVGIAAIELAQQTAVAPLRLEKVIPLEGVQGRDRRLLVAKGNDGSVRLFDGSSLQPLKSVPYGDDADNLRFAGGHVWVGYGSGALANWTRRERRSRTSASTPIRNHFNWRKPDLASS